MPGAIFDNNRVLDTWDLGYRKFVPGQHVRLAVTNGDSIVLTPGAHTNQPYHDTQCLNLDAAANGQCWSLLNKSEEGIYRYLVHFPQAPELVDTEVIGWQIPGDENVYEPDSWVYLEGGSIPRLFEAVFPIEGEIPDDVDGQCGDNCFWRLDEDGTMTIFGTGGMWHWNDNPGYGEPAPWADRKNEIKRVVVSNGIEYLGEFTFNNCPNLTSVSLPVGLTSIGAYSFQDCINLTGIEIPESVEYIYTSAFERTGLTEINLPSHLQVMGIRTFAGCQGLTSVEIPGTFRYANWGCFQECHNLTEVTYNEGVRAIELLTFDNCYNLKTIRIPQTMEYIAEAAFNGCTSLTDVYYSAPREMLNVNVDEGYFEEEDGTVWDTNNWDFLPPFDDWHYQNAAPNACGENVHWRMDGTVLTIYGEGAMWDQWVRPNADGEYNIEEQRPLVEAWANATSVVFEEGVTRIGSFAFVNCSNLKSIKFASTIESIGYGAFNGCSGLTSVDIPGTVKWIESEAFMRCTGLTNATIREGVQEMQYNIFNSCTNLRTVVIEAQIDRLWNYTFFNCTRLTSVTLPASLKVISEGAFANCTALKSIKLPTGLTEISRLENEEDAWGSFEGCKNLTSVVIPEGVTYIGGLAFSQCTALKTVTLPSTLRTIDTEAFFNCNHLTGLKLPAGLTTIGYNAFNRCSALTKVEIPGSVERIEDSAFFGCTGLTEVTIRDGVEKTIGNGAFNFGWFADEGYTPKLKKVTIGEGVTFIDDYAFCNNDNLTTLYLPHSLQKIGQEAFSSPRLTDVNYAGLQDSWDQIEIADGNDGLANVKFQSGPNRCGDNATWELDRYGTLTISGTGAMWHWNDFGKYGKTPAPWASQKSKIKRVVVEEGITELGDFVFSSCPYLTSVSLPDSLEIIAGCSFYNCPRLTSIEIPESVKRIKSSAFEATGLTSVKLPSHLDQLGGYAFYNCKKLTSVTFPETMASFDGVSNGMYVGNFSGCTGLKEVIIPGGIDALGEYTFQNCTNLTRVIIQEGVETVKASAFVGCTNLTTIQLPESLKTVDNYAFDACDNLTDVYYAGTDPESIEIAPAGNGRLVFAPNWYYGDTAASCGTGVYWYTDDTTLVVYGQGVMDDYYRFPDPASITEVIVSEGVTRLGHGAFMDFSNLTQVSLPSTLTEIGAGAFKRCAKLAAIEIPASVTWIDDNTFNGCSSLKEVVLPQGIPEIDNYTFQDCTSLERVSIPGSVKRIGQYAFQCCTALTEIDIPQGVTNIDNGAFFACYGLSSVTLPEGLERLSVNAFGDCTALTEIDIPESLTTLSPRAFYHCTSLESVSIPGSVGDIGDQAFQKCYSLKSVELGEGITRIGNGSFIECWSLTDVALPDTLTTIANDAFSNCRSLEHIDLPNGVTDIGQYAFLECMSLKSVVIPEGMTRIGYGVFKDCSTLTSVTIPETVTYIADAAFMQCWALEAIEIPASVTQIGSEAFRNCNRLSLIKLPATIEYIAEGAFSYWGGFRDVYVIYGGTKEDKENISIDMNNPKLDEAIWFCGADSLLGRCGEGVYWRFTESTGQLTIFGSGNMALGEALWDNSQVKSVFFVDGVNSVAPGAFAGCTQLTEVHLAESISSIGAEAFAGCTNLNEITIPGNVAFTDEDANIFAGCTGLEDVIFNTGVAAIPGGMFTGCENLSAVTIPETVKKIGTDAFAGCDNLSEIFYSGTEKQWSAIKGSADLADTLKTFDSDGPTYTVKLNREYLILGNDSASQTLRAETSPTAWAENVVWHVESAQEGEAPVIEILDAGTGASCEFAPVVGSRGTAYLVAEVAQKDGSVESARCRIDVVDWPVASLVQEVKLSATSLTTELYKTDYTKFHVYIGRYDLVSYSMEDDRPEDNGLSVTDAKFTDDTLNGYFDLVVKDDGEIWIVPTADAIRDAAKIKGSYAAEIKVMIGGQWMPSENQAPLKVKLVVKKTTPRLKASTLSFNSFIDDQQLPLNITGGDVTVLGPNTTTRYGDNWKPDWLADLTVDNTGLYLADSETVGTRSRSGNVYLMTQVDGYTTEKEWPVTVPVRVSRSLPKVALSTTSVTFFMGTDQIKGAALKLLSKQKGMTLADLGVTDLTSATEGVEVSSFNLEDGTFVLTHEDELSTRTYKPVQLLVSFDDLTTQTVPLNMKIKGADVTLKLGKSSLTVNPDVVYATPVKLTHSPVDFDMQYPNVRVTRLVGRTYTEVTGELEFAYDAEMGTLYVYTTAGTVPGSTYAVYLSAYPGCKEYKLTVKTLTPDKKTGWVPVSSTLKASGYIDQALTDKEIILVPSYKNYLEQGDEGFNWTIAEKNGRTLVNEDVSHLFQIELAQDGFHIKEAEPGTLNLKHQYYFTLHTFIQGRPQVDSNPIKLSVKRTSLGVKLAKTSISLNERFLDKAVIPVSCTTKGYNIENLDITIMDGKYEIENGGELLVYFQDGQLHVESTRNTASRHTYKVLVSIPGHKTATLTVKSMDGRMPIVSAKVSGSIDVLRPGNAVTITPSVRNYMDTASIRYTLAILRVIGRDWHEWPDCTNDFIVRRQADGSFKVYPTDAVVAGQKYSFMLNGELMEKDEGRYPQFGTVGSTLPVKMGSAKFTSDKKAVTLYVKDRYSSETIRLDTSDETLSGIGQVRIRDGRFAVEHLGGSQYAIGFNQQAEYPTKTVRTYIDIYLKGSSSPKPNVSIPVTVNILK